MIFDYFFVSCGENGKYIMLAFTWLASCIIGLQVA